MSGSIRQIAVLGSGIEAALAERVLRHRTGLSVRRFADREYAPDPLTHAALTPGSLRGLDQAGVGLRDLLSLPGSLPSLGRRFEIEGHASYQPYGPCGVDWGGIEFHHYWLRALQGGLPLPYAAFSPAFGAMRAKRFAPPDPRNQIGPLQHESGLHISTTALFQELTGSADAGPVARLRRSAEGHRLELHGGALIEAHLIIDAREPASPGRVSLDDHVETPSPFATWRKEGETWSVSAPRRDGVLNGHLDCATPDGPLQPPWTGNLLRIGRAAHGLPPHSGRLTEFALFELNALVDLLPDQNFAEDEISEYNRIWMDEAEELRALTALYLGADNQRKSERMEMFEHRGYVRPLDTEVVKARDWIEDALALGHTPRHFDPLCLRLDDVRLKQELSRLLKRIEAVSAEFPPLSAYLDAIDQSLAKTRAAQ